MTDQPATTERLLDSKAAGGWLNEALPDKTPAQWALWLRNNRNQSREASYRVNARRFSGKACYLLKDLEKFVVWEKSRLLGTVKLTGRAAELMLAFGMGEAGGGNYGRKLAYSVQLAFEEDDPSKQFVRLMIERPLGVFRLDADEAEGLAKDLRSAANAVRRHADYLASKLPNPGDYETLVETNNLTVKRRKATE